MKRAVKQILDLQDFRVIGDGLDHAELRPGLQFELEDRQRSLHARVHALGRDADLLGEVAKAHMMVILLHRDPAGKPFRVRRRRQRDRRFVEHLGAIKFVDGVADDDFLDRLAIVFGLRSELGCALDFECGDGRHDGSLGQSSGSVLNRSRSVARSVRCGPKALAKALA